MVSEVAARILKEGLISRQELSEALADSSNTRCIVARVVDRGVDADQVLALFDDFGPPVGPVALAGAPTSLITQLPARMAQSFFALPVAQGNGFVVVAMADPSHRHAIEELGRALAQPIEARPARVGDLRQALIRSYPDYVHELHADDTAMDPEPNAVQQDKPGLTDPTGERPEIAQEGPANDVVLLTAVKTPAPATRSSLSDIAVPLSRRKPQEEPPRPVKTFRRPTEQLEVVKDDNSWADLDRISRPDAVGVLVELGPLLATIRDAPARDDVIVATAEAASHFARSAVILTLRRGVLRGAEARGDGISTDAVRNLWIPATSPSMFRMVVEAKDIYRGPFGGSAADHLYRAAIGSRGGNVEIHPVDVQGTVVAVLCADDPVPDPTASLGVIAHAMGEALTRLLKS